MQSSTLVLGLLFVFFVDTIAHRSQEIQVISYAEQLQVVGPPVVHLNSTNSKHAASDSSNHPLFPKDNVKRAMKGTAMRNISSLDTPSPALVDNSSELVEAMKSTSVVNETTEPTCYRSRQSAPIANPSHCIIAIYQILAGGDPDEAVLWRGRETWTWLTCKVELVLRAGRAEYLARAELSQTALLIQRDCVIVQHGYRGGYIWVGLISVLKVWASTSSVIMNETTSALSHPLDSTDPLETGLDSS